MTPLEYIEAVIVAYVTGVGVGAVVWIIHRKHFL